MTDDDSARRQGDAFPTAAGDDDGIPRNGHKGPFVGHWGERENIARAAEPAFAPWVRDFVLDLAENSAADPNKDIAVVLLGAGALTERVTRRERAEGVS